MTVYIVTGVRPNYQVFIDEQKAINFAFAKAAKRRGGCNVWAEYRGKNYTTTCLNPDTNGESHIYINKREINN